MKIKLLLLAFLLLPLKTFSTHIIGGTLEYSYLGNDQYQLHLIVYRDCINGVPPFDEPAVIGVYDALDSLVTTLYPSVNDSSDVFVQGSCIPGNVCIRKANYYSTITLPAAGGPYTVAYQRCCRSVDVINIWDPMDYGMTFYNQIPTVPNNSPVFENEFAAFTYIGDNFSFDASAVDSDGDVLVYSLDDVHDGADTFDPMPDPPLPPPYLVIPWQVQYDINNMLGGPVPLTIDPVTGIMTAVPGDLGVFVVSMKVDEYRSGVLISTTRREFVIAVNPGSYFDVEGMILADNGSQPLDIGKSWLIRKNLLDSSLTATDTNIVSNGYYTQPQAINGVYLIKGSADMGSAFYSNNIPTYYGDVLFWYDATEFELCASNLSGIDINLVQGINPGGPGFIGGLISQGANRSSSVMTGSMEGVTVILFNMSNQPVAYDVADVNGNFGIGNLPVGDYKIYIDRLNYMVDNSIAPVISLSVANPVQNNLSFLMHSTWVEHNGYVGTTEMPLAISEFSLFPNPVSEILFVNAVGNSLYGKNYAIYNLLGEEILNGKFNSNSIIVSQLPPQIYLIKADLTNGTEYAKFVKW